MYLSAMIGLLTEGMIARRQHRQASDHHGPRMPAGLAGLSDHELRDIGYLRERTIAPGKHVLWM